MLAARFRVRHVETLLDQAATLIDRCLTDYSDYSSLDYAWHRFETDLVALEKQLDLDKKREGEGESELAAAGEENVSEEVEQSASEPYDEAEAEALASAVDLSEPEGESGSPAAEVFFPKTVLELRAETVQRTKELSAPGRPFAINEQRDLTLKRLCRDYEEAINRALVAEEGLKTIFGYVAETPALPFEAETLGSSITSLSIWIRNAIEWLAGYRQQEQEFTRVVSLRALLNRNAWTNLRHARDSFSTKLRLPAELFREHDNCRLLGLGAALVGEAGTVPWSLLLRLPDEAVYERSGQSVEVDQSALAPCHLGRVENRRSARELERCGAVSHLNASPVGRSTSEGLWYLELEKPLGASSESFTHVEDVVLELNLVGKPHKRSR